jgi:formate dehydrogenase major subunit/formate dehydrogenase alpha subunit
LGRGASTNSIPEIENARFLLVIGSNTTEAHPVLALRMKKAVRKGATLVVCDPRKIWLTKIAKRHLQLRPGSDVWLINAMLNVIFEEGLQDDAYIAEHTVDVEAVREIVQRYSPEAAEVMTGVPAEDIRATAREYATERHAAIFYTLGITEHACAVDNIWSLSNLVLATGHLGYESTGLNALRGQNNVQGLNDSGANPAYFPGYQAADDPEVLAKFESAWGVELPETPGYRLDQIISGLHDGRIKALYLVGENPAHTEPNAKHVEEGFEHVEFVVAQDLFLNDLTEKYADVVFPASSFAEKDGTFTNTERRINRVRAAVPCPGEARVDREIVIGFARAMGASWPEYPDAEAVWNELADLSPNWYGIRYDRLEEQGLQWPCLDRDDPGSRFLHADGPARPGGGKFWPVEYQPPIELPDAEYPLTLSTGRTLYHYNSATMTMREAGITDKQEDPFFEVSAEDASALGLADGDWARLVSRRGDLEARAKITDRVYPGLVWMALHFAQAKVNWLTHDVGDPLIGTPEYKVSAVRVEPARLAPIRRCASG